MRNRQHQFMPRMLGYAGVAPVLCLLVVAWSDSQWQQQALTLACTYGALILSFLGGIHWGFATSGVASMKHFMVSVIPSLWAWAALASPDLYTVSGLIIGLVLFLLFERRLAWIAQLPNWYLPLRLQLTIGLSAGLAGFLPLAA